MLRANEFVQLFHLLITSVYVPDICAVVCYRVYVRACMRANVHECVRACVRARACVCGSAD